MVNIVDMLKKERRTTLREQYRLSKAQIQPLPPVDRLKWFRDPRFYSGKVSYNRKKNELVMDSSLTPLSYSDKLLYSFGVQPYCNLHAVLHANVDKDRKIVHSPYSAYSGKVFKLTCCKLLYENVD